MARGRQGARANFRFLSPFRLVPMSPCRFIKTCRSMNINAVPARNASRSWSSARIPRSPARSAGRRRPRSVSRSSAWAGPRTAPAAAPDAGGAHRPPAQDANDRSSFGIGQRSQRDHPLPTFSQNRLTVSIRFLSLPKSFRLKSRSNLGMWASSGSSCSAGNGVATAP